MSLLDIVPIWAALLSIGLAVGGLMVLLHFRVIRSLADPNIISLFQVIFTFLILLLLRELLTVDAIGFLIFIGLLVKFQNKERAGAAIIPQEDWVEFCKVFAIVLVFLNIYLLSQKGFILFLSNVSTARVGFYQGWGVFERFNEVGIGITSITAAILWHRNDRKQAIALAIFSAYLALTLGSHSGLILCFLAYGAYLHFAKERISNRRIVVAGAALSLSSLVVFFVMVGPRFLGAFAYRILSFADGPVYYFSDRMYRYSNYPLSYPFSDLLIDLRLKSGYSVLPLGRFVNFHHFGIDTPLFGANPQMFIESHAAFHWLSISWYVVIAALFIALRKQASTPFSFYLGCLVAGPLLIDTQLAGSELVTVTLLLLVVGVFLGARQILRHACAHARQLA